MRYFIPHYINLFPNGASLQVSHVVKAILSHDIIFQDVLCVPNFSCNLLFMSKLTKDLNCAVLFFFPDFCLLQDLHSRKLIGVSKLREGLYHCFLPKTVSPPVAHHAAISQSTSLWHMRLGHPSIRSFS